MKRSKISNDLWTKHACGALALLFLMAMSVSIVAADAGQSHAFQ